MEFNLIKAIEILERTPKILNNMLYGLSDDWVYCNEGEKTWSAFDIVGHLIHGEKTDWIIRTKTILEYQDQQPFKSFDRFAQFENSKEKSLHGLLVEFSKLRTQNLMELQSFNLTEKMLNLEGIHPELGRVTLKQLLATWVTHDLGHIAQIARVLAKQYKNEVGVWHQYISILNDRL